MKNLYYTFLLAVLMSVVGAKAYAYDAKIDGICYDFSGTKATVTWGGSYSGYVTIPKTVTYNGTTYSVTSIGNRAFFGCSGLTSVTIPNSVTSIGEYAFYDCSSLTSVHISDLAAWCKISFNSSDSNPLYYAHHLYLNGEEIKDLVIPNSVTSIGNRAFYGCSGLTSVTIPNSVTTIGTYAFSKCSGLKEVNYNATNCTSMGSSSYPVFSNCTSLKTLNIGDNVQTIPAYAFYSCSGLTSVTIPNSVTSIGAYAFYSCSGLTSVTIPNSVTSIGAYAFYGCSGLQSVVIGNSITSLPDYVFGNGVRLKSLTIGSGVLSISSYAFINGSNTYKPVKTIWLTNTPPSGYSYAAGTVNYVANDLYTSLSNKTVYPFLSSLFTADGVKYVPVSPSERTCDAIDCLYDESAEDIHVGPTVTNKGITLIVNRIHPYTFYNNSYVKNAEINFAGDVGSNAFYGCTNLLSIDIPDVITEVGAYAFYNCSSMISAKIGTGVNAINSYTFYGCSALTEMLIGNNVSLIDTYAFSGCSSLPDILIPKSVTDIKNYVFQGCRQLQIVDIADREEILSLGSNGSSPMFADCPLDSVYIGGNISYNTSSSYGYSPFYRNTSLRSVMITDKETEISENEFYGCTNLKNVCIGDGVETIGNWAFSGCSSLDYFAFGTALKSIGKEAFSDCTAVTRIISHAETPPTCGSQALDDINKWNCTLQVPAGGMSAYQAADQWKEFFFIEEEDVSGNIYKLTYFLDGEEYKVYEMHYGDVITPEPVVPDEAHEFSGWIGLPETMPAKDVTVTGTITLNVQKWIDETESSWFRFEIVYPNEDNHWYAIASEEKNLNSCFSFLLYDIKKLYGEGITITEDDINKFNEGYNILYDFGTISKKNLIGNSFTTGIGGKIQVGEHEIIENKNNYGFTWFHSNVKEDVRNIGNKIVCWWNSLDPGKYLWVSGNDMWNGRPSSYYDPITISVIADEGYHIKSIQIDGVEQDKTTFSSDEASGESFVVVFEKDDVVITENGTTIRVKADNTVVLSDCSNASGTFTVPESLEHDGVEYQITSIGEDAFKGNTELTELMIPNTIKVIENQSFEGCVNLKKIVIGSGVTSIGSMAFANISTSASPLNRAGSNSLQVYCFAEQMPETALDAFSGTAISEAILYVKDELINSYKDTAPWSGFGIIKGLSEATGILPLVNDNDNANYYSLDGRKLQGKPTQKGVYINNGTKVVIK